MIFSSWFAVWFEKALAYYSDKAYVLSRFSIIPGVLFSFVFHALIPVTGDSTPAVWHVYLLLLPALLVIWLVAGLMFFRYFFSQTRETLANAEVWDVSDRAETTAVELIRFPLKYVTASWLTGWILLIFSGLILFWFSEEKDGRWILRGVLTTLMGLNLYAIIDYILLNRMIAPILKWMDDKKFSIRHLPFQFYDEPFIVYALLGFLTGCSFGLWMHHFPLTNYAFWWTLMIWAFAGIGLIFIRHRQWIRFHQHLDIEASNGRKIRTELLMPALWTLIQRVNTMKRLFYDLLLNIENNSSEMNAAARVVAETSTEQNAALVRQSASVTQTTSTLQELVQAAKQIAESSSAVVNFAESTQTKAESGHQVMQHTVASVQKVRQENETNLSEVIILSEAIIEIDQVLNFIISIADETNLIALNAAIEASSAGEQGKRFKIVANEVRSLSTRVTRSIRHVKETIRKIQEATSRLVQTVQNHQEVIDESVDWVDQSLANLEEILENAVQSADAAKQIYIAIQQQKIANQQIAASFTDISNDIRQLASASERYNQYVSALKKFSANIDRALHELQVDRIRQKDDEWLLS